MRSPLDSRTAEEQYRDLVAHAPIGIYRSTRDGQFVSVNEAYARLLGYESPEEVLRLDLRRDIYFDNADRERLIAEIEQRGGGAATEVRLRRRDGSPVWVRLEGRVIRGGSGSVEFFEDFVHDIQQQKRAEEALRQSEERFRRSFAASPVGMSLSESKSGLLIDVNESFARMLGYEREELIGRSTVGLGLWIDLAERQRLVESIQTSLPIREREVRLRTKSGGIAHILGSVEPLQVGEEQVFLSVFQDITERKRAEEALQQSKERLRLILETAHEAFVAINAEGEIVDWNPQAEETFGWSIEEALGRTLAHMIIPERYRDAHESGLKRFLETGAGPVLGHWFELSALHRDGHEFPVELMISPMRWDQGYLFNAFLHDVSERKATERRLQERTTFLNALVESSPLATLVLDPSHCIRIANPAFVRLFGYSPEELAGRNPDDLIAPGDLQLRSEAEAFTRDCLAGHPVHVATTRRRKEGSSVEVELYGVPLMEEGRLIGVYAIYQDVTERTLLEAQLRQSQKMEAVGTLAGGVAHDFNNLLTTILGYSELVLQQLDAESPLREEIGEIQRAGGRAADLTRQLLAFSRKQVLAPVVLDLNAAVADMEKMLRRLIGEDVSLAAELDPNLWSVRADPGQVEQVIVNLVVNARDAMPRGGKVTIETRNIDFDDSYVRAHSYVRPGEHVCLSVSDTGTGMDAQTRSRIFEPFFTTKGPAKGTGLGLSTVYGIVKQSDGSIEADSEPGRGTSFKIYLPRVFGAEERAAPQARRPAPNGSETVLLVEDEEAVRRLARLVLEKRGYAVLEAGSAEDAQSIVASRAGAIDLLLTDSIMPGMSGPALAQQLRSQRPGLKVLFMSGYTDDAIVRHGLLGVTEAFLQKPFTPDSLARKVREVLDAKEAYA